jgi:hypothetical protein
VASRKRYWEDPEILFRESVWVLLRSRITFGVARKAVITK